MQTRILLTCLCLAAVSCAKEPPPEPPPVTPAEDLVARLNTASIALRREQRKLYLLQRDHESQERGAAYQVFSAMLPQGMTIKGLHTVYLDPRRGGDGIDFDPGVTDDHTDAEKANLQKVREFTNKFAAECKQPDSPTAKKVAAEIGALPVTKELRQQQELVDKLRRERDEAQAAVPLEKPNSAEENPKSAD